MTYPLKDKAKAARIESDFNKMIDDIMNEKTTYDKEIAKLRKKSIPPGLINKLIDVRFGKSHGFEEMNHNHTKNTRLSVINCIRCQYNQREIESENLIDNLTGSEETQIEYNGVITSKSLKMFKIVRGRFDDVIGFSWSWG